MASFPRFGMDYSTKTRSELARVLYKRKMALTNDQATLKKLEHRLAEVQGEPESEYKPHYIRYTQYLITHTKFRIEGRECDIDLVKAYKEAPKTKFKKA